MNIFEQYGIKEVADVCLYSIELDENDDEVYIPVLYLDTLKVSTVAETASQTSARGGLGNPELIIWDYGKEITVTLEDALYSPASMGMIWGGKHGTKTFDLYGTLSYMGSDGPKEVSGKLIVKNLSDYSYDESRKIAIWTCGVTAVSTDGRERYGSKKVMIAYNVKAKSFGLYDEEKGQITNKIRLNSNIKRVDFIYVPSRNQNLPAVQELIYEIEHGLNDVAYLERIEKCKATQTFVIDTDKNTRHGNYRYIEKYSNNALTVFIDPKTMQPYEPNTDEFTRKNGQKISGNFRIIKQHEIYYKWTRSKAADNTTLGHQIIVDAVHFPGTYRLVGETYARSRKTGKDERFQFEIPLCKMGSENNFTLEAEGEPTTFSMTLKVLRREDGVMMKLTQYDVATAKYDGYNSGSTKVVPEDSLKREETDVPEVIEFKETEMDMEERDISYDIIRCNNFYFVGDTITRSTSIKSTDGIGVRRYYQIITRKKYQKFINGKPTNEYLTNEDGTVKVVENITSFSEIVDPNLYDLIITEDIEEQGGKE